MVRLSVDFEFASRTWWNSGGQELWDGIAEGFDGSAVILEENLAKSWLIQAREVPGWDDGHDYAPHPVGLSEIDEDEEL